MSIPETTIPPGSTAKVPATAAVPEAGDVAAISSAAEPDKTIRWRMRRDLEVTRLTFSGTPLYTVKDPIATRFFQLREEEYFLLTQLNGSATINSLQRSFERRFSGRRLNARQLQLYLSTLEQQSLIIGVGPGHGHRLRQRHAAQRRADWLQRLTGFLAIRFRGFDPQRFLETFYVYCRWLFDWRILCAAVGLMIAAVALVFTKWDLLTDRLPEFSAFLTLQNFINMALAVAIVKVLHEMGHALTCQHFGGECHEMGLMLLVLTPCLYCDVSDAWRMPNKWHRIAISGAGIFVELTLAAVCTLLWWITEPGWLNVILLNMMIVCSVNTLLFNGNPLLRFDGYFVLADLMEIPNLKQTSGHAFQNWLASMVLGIRTQPSRRIPGSGRWSLILYAIAAAVYRVLVIFGIVWMLHAVLGQMGLLPVANLAAVSLVSMMLFSGVTQVRNLLSMLTHRSDLRRSRLFLVTTLGIALILAFFLWPLPDRISAPCIASVYEGQTVFVSVDGRRSPAQSCVRAGDMVQQGDILTQLQNLDLDVRMADLSGQIAVLESRLESLRIRRVTDPSKAALIPATEESLQDLLQQRDSVRAQHQQLTLLAPCSGMVFPVDRGALPMSDTIERTDCDLLDPRCSGDTLISGTPFCQIGAPIRRTVLLYVDQADIELVQPGQTVTFRMDSVAEFLTGEVTEISSNPVTDIPPNLVATGMLPMLPATSGADVRPASVVFLVNATLLPTEKNPSGDATQWPKLPAGTTGFAAVRTAPCTLAGRLRRFIYGTLRFTTDFQQR